MDLLYNNHTAKMYVSLLFTSSSSKSPIICTSIIFCFEFTPITDQDAVVLAGSQLTSFSLACTSIEGLCWTCTGFPLIIIGGPDIPSIIPISLEDQLLQVYRTSMKRC
jgi:hypothetical protein